MNHYTIHDLSSDRTKRIEGYIDRTFAVAQATALDQSRFDILLGMYNAGSDWKREFQVTTGKRTIACGNWCVLKEAA